MILCVDNILDEPVELPCKQMIRCSCCFDHLKNNINSFCCAGCKQNHLLSNIRHALTVNKILELPLTFVHIKFRSTNMTVLLSTLDKKFFLHNKHRTYLYPTYKQPFKRDFNPQMVPLFDIGYCSLSSFNVERQGLLLWHF